MPRGRPRKIPSTLPPSYRMSHGAAYHIVRGKWIPIGKTEADAHQHHADRLRQPSGKLDPLIDAVLARMKTRKVEPLSENTKRQYGESAEILKGMLKQFSDPAQVKQKDAAKLKVLMAATPGMANRVLSFGRVVFTDFVEHQLVDGNPFLGVKRYPQVRRDRLITQAEWDAIYAKANARLQGVMDGMFLTDQRVDDVIGLDERNVLDDGPGIYFKQRKTSKELIIAWNPQLREWIARCRALHGKVLQVDFVAKDRPRPLFRARGSNRRPSYYAVLKDWHAALAASQVLYCQMRDNRAFAATEANRQGLDAQKLLGHTTPATTRIYLRGREIDIVQGPQMLRTA